MFILLQLWKVWAPEINPCTYDQLNYDKRDETGKDNLFNKWCGENWAATCKRKKLELL